MGGSAQEQFKGIPAGCAYQVHRTEPLVEGTTGGTVTWAGLRLCGTCCRCDKVPEQTGFPPYQYRGYEKPRGCPDRDGDAPEALRVREQPQHLRRHQGAASLLPYIILRPTGVYGPREKDYYIMAKSIKQHIDFAVGYQRQDITFVYVQDVVQAVFLALEKGQTGRKYFLSDGEVYQSTTFSDLIHEELGRPWWLRITAPVWVLRIVTFFGEYAGRMTGKVTALNNDKYNILKQRNWRCDITPARKELGFEPKVQLQEGVKTTIKWYKDHGWL